MSASTGARFSVQPAAAACVEPYWPSRPRAGATLRLDGNEGDRPPQSLLRELAESPAALLRDYPRATDLEGDLAGLWDLPPERVLVTCGGDDAIDRACRASLEPGRTLVLPVPTFHMISRFARHAGAALREVPWTGEALPVEALIEAAGPTTGMIAVVSPNNPTGSVASFEDLRQLSAAAPQALLLLDAVYGEYADEDLTRQALMLPNVLVVKSFSKAWGLAGCRVGYALGHPQVVGWMRTLGGPYPAAGPSLWLARRRLAAGPAVVADHVAQVRDERARLTDLLCAGGARPWPSQGNFVCARFEDAPAVVTALAEGGIAVRDFSEHPQIPGSLRITCPGDEASYRRLADALAVALDLNRNQEDA
jgi:histidinol-phosphate aminotransferase